MSGPELHPSLEHLAFLVGEWHGLGVVGYPTITEARYEQEVSFSHDGRPFLAYNIDLTASHIGGFDADLVHEFFQAFTSNSGVTLHIRLQAGTNPNRVYASVFNGFGKSLERACAVASRLQGVPPNRGVL